MRSYRRLEFLLLDIYMRVDLAGIIPQDTRSEDFGLVFGKVSHPKEAYWTFSRAWEEGNKGNGHEDGEHAFDP